MGCAARTDHARLATIGYVPGRETDRIELLVASFATPAPETPAGESHAK